jgi:hypothetical protein
MGELGEIAYRRLIIVASQFQRDQVASQWHVKLFGVENRVGLQGSYEAIGLHQNLKQRYQLPKQSRLRSVTDYVNSNVRGA